MIQRMNFVERIRKKRNMEKRDVDEIRIVKMSQGRGSGIAKNNQGMTIVEVLVGFVILSIIMGMLSGIIAFASNLYYESVDLRNAEYELMESVYSKNVVNDATANGSVKKVDIKLKPQNGSNGSEVTVKDAKLYQINTTHFQDVQDIKEIDMEFYFFHK